MKPLNLCVTTFNRQDLLGACLRTACAGTRKPDHIYLVDQANRKDLIFEALRGLEVDYTLIDLCEYRGSEAAAINYYFDWVSEERVIAHEDVVFAPDSLERFLSVPGDFVIDQTMGVMTYRDPCRLAGYYDLQMSPNYFRFVDVDFEDRLAELGIHPTVVDAGIRHVVDGTMKGCDAVALAEYHRRVEIARVNYERKWGRPVTPGGNTIGRGIWRQNNHV